MEKGAIFTNKRLEKHQKERAAIRQARESIQESLRRQREDLERMLSGRSRFPFIRLPV